MKDLIDNLTKGQTLFGQKFVYCGFLNDSAKAIIAEKLSNRFAVLVRGCSNSSGYYISLYLGSNGHGFADKRSANAHVTLLKRIAKRKELCQDFIVIELNALDKAINAIRNKRDLSWWNPQYANGFVNLVYA